MSKVALHWLRMIMCTMPHSSTWSSHCKAATVKKISWTVSKFRSFIYKLQRDEHQVMKVQEKRILGHMEIWNFSSYVKKIFVNKCSKYFQQEKKNFIYSGHVMFYLLHKHHNDSSPGIFIGFYRQLSLKGHSKLIHMWITYQFLADLHITRQLRKTESENCMLEFISKQTMWSWNCKSKSWESKSYQGTYLLVGHWEFTDGLVQTLTNTYELEASVESYS